MMYSRKAILATSLLALTSSLTGCTLATTAAPSIDFVPGAAITGTVHGGSQPFFGAKVYLLAASATGYAGPGLTASSSNASVSLLNPALTGNAADSIGSYVLTDSLVGAFTLSHKYSCTSGYAQGTASSVTLSGTEQVYLYILGGTPQNSPSANTSSGMLAALGACNNPTTSVTVNEITTAATAYAFAGFATDATHIGSTNGTQAQLGIANAFGNVANLASISGGSATASTASITRPVANLTSIADILAACVNGTTNNSNCVTLFQYTKSSGASGTAATDTATAAINLAHNPYPTAAGMTALYGLIPGTGAPFTGGLSAQPTDFTLGLSLTGGGLNRPNGVAIDGSGNAWVANTSCSCVSEFSAAGVAITTSAGYTAGGVDTANDLAIDSSGNVWVATLSGKLAAITSAGAAYGSSPFTGGGLSTGQPSDLTIDYGGNVWVVDYINNGGAISKFNSSGTAVSSTSGYTGGGQNDSEGISIDLSGNAWVANTGNSSLTKLNSSGVAQSGSGGYTGGGLTSPTRIVFDASGNAWTAGSGSNNLVGFNSSGTAISGSGGYSGGGLDFPRFLAIDGNGTYWVSNQSGSSISAFSSAGVALSPPNPGSGTYYGGYTGGSPSTPQDIAVDGSGNVWFSNYNSSGLSELIGAAAPVLTPVVSNQVIGRISTGTLVNRP